MVSGESGNETGIWTWKLKNKEPAIPSGLWGKRVSGKDDS